MKAYNYFLFRVYWFYRDRFKEGHKMSLISTSIVATVIIFFIVIITIGSSYFLLYESTPSLGKSYKIIILCFMFTLWLLNYYFVIKPKLFLKKNFEKDKKGGYAIIGFIVLLAFSFVFIANKNREKIFKERGERNKIENVK
jgi:hypothetical protein